MIMKLVGIFLFWRKNNLASILFKCAVWAGIAWLVVGIFSDVRTALIGGLAAGLVAAIRYSYQAHKKKIKMMKLAGGDKEKYKALKKQMNAGGLGGSFVNELMLAAADEMEEDEEELEEEELDEATVAKNIAETKRLAEWMQTLTTDGEYLSNEAAESAFNEAMEDYGDGQSIISTDELISTFLPDNLLHICGEDFINEDDHAGLMEEFALATNNRWKPTKCHSYFDEESGKWVLTHQQDGKQKTWRFPQDGDWLTDKFLNTLIQYTEQQSGHHITILDNEDMIVAACLPPEIHAALIGSDDELKQAA